MLEKIRLNGGIDDNEYYNECKSLIKDYDRAAKNINSYEGIDYFDKVKFLIVRNTISIWHRMFGSSYIRKPWKNLKRWN